MEAIEKGGYNMDRRTFLKATGASVTGAMLSAPAAVDHERSIADLLEKSGE